MPDHENAVIPLARAEALSQADLLAYAEASSTPLSGVLADIRGRYADEIPDPEVRREWISGTIEGRLVAALIHVGQARNVLELGAFVGYGAIVMAAALPAGGRVTTCEVDPEYAAIARRNIDASGYAHLIDLDVRPASEVIESVRDPLDLVYMDADKENQLAYVEALLPKLSPNGIIVVDNTVSLGPATYVADRKTETSRYVDDFNRAIARDRRVQATLLPFGEGVTLIWKPQSAEASER